MLKGLGNLGDMAKMMKSMQDIQGRMAAAQEALELAGGHAEGRLAQHLAGGGGVPAERNRGHLAVDADPGGVGLVEAVGAGYIEHLTFGFLNSSYQDIFAFVILGIVLIFRPTGLLGERVSDRA